MHKVNASSDRKVYETTVHHILLLMGQQEQNNIKNIDHQVISDLCSYLFIFTSLTGSKK